MKLCPKSINLKERYRKDNITDEDIQEFIDEIKNSLSKIKKFINNFENLDNKELYNSLGQFCDIIYESKDYLRILSKAYKHHYTDYICINTYMIDEDGKSIDFFGVTTKDNVRFDDTYLLVNEIRNLVKNNEFIILNTVRQKKANKTIHEKYENLQYLNININNSLEDDNELFIYALNQFKKEISKKDILYNVRLYYKELMFQIKKIIDKKDLSIGKKYKEAYDKATSEKYIPKVNRIIVTHEKNSFKK